MKDYNEYIVEGSGAYEVYHDTYTSSIEAMTKFVKKKGFILDDNETFQMIGTGPSKPGAGKTNRFSLTLYKNKKDLELGKPQRKKVHFQVYGMGSTKALSADKYELNVYIS